MSKSYTDDTRSEHLATFHFLRQQMQKPAGQSNHCLADFVAPKESGRADYLGGFAVTAGLGADELAKSFSDAHDDYNAILTKALADRLAEAFAEYLHQQARIAWGFGAEEKLSHEELIRERYRGIRPAAGYPASPDHTEKRTLFQLLQPERNAGDHADGIIRHASGRERQRALLCPSGGKVLRRRQDRARPGAGICRAQRGEPVEFVEKWLAPNLGLLSDRPRPALLLRRLAESFNEGSLIRAPNRIIAPASSSDTGTISSSFSGFGQWTLQARPAFSRAPDDDSG